MLHRHAKNERSRVRARQQVFVFRLHRFTGKAFFVYTQGVVGEGFRKKASPFVHRRRPFEGMHTPSQWAAKNGDEGLKNAQFTPDCPLVSSLRWVKK